jgi:ankyrin repeat protein
MAPPDLPLDLLLMIAHQLRDDHGEFCYGDFNSFLQVNRVLHACLNCNLWKEAVKDKVGTRRALTHLLKTNNLARLEFFLELGADIDVRLTDFDITDLRGDEYDESGPTLLLAAADLDNLPLARLLLEKGAKVQYFSAATGGEFSPLHAARSAEMVQFLLDHNADPNLVDEFESQPLHWYAMRDDMAAMRTILQHGAEVDPNTAPLHHAAENNLEAVVLLVERGADVEMKDYEEMTPLHSAAAAGNTDVVKFLLERWPEGARARNENRETPLHLAAATGDVDVVRLLVEQWPEGLREVSCWLMTPLHYAVAHGRRIEAVEFLVKGWPEAIRKKDKYRNTPLHLAAETEVLEVVEFLVERWPEAKEARNNHNGETPLSMFEKRMHRVYEVYFKDRERDKEKEERIIALLGGPSSQANNDRRDELA